MMRDDNAEIARRTLCALCTQALPTDRRATIAVEYAGWAVKRRGGGLHALRAKEETGRYAHTQCVDMKVAGIDPEHQGRLL